MRMYSLFAGVCLMLGGALFLGLPRASAQCSAADGTIDNSGDTITCNSTNTPLVAGNGNDSVVVQTGATVTDANNSTLATVSGGTGNDTIINFGTVNGTNTGFMGNGLEGGTGTNLIINHGSVSVNGTNAAGIRDNLGTVINNGSVTSTGGSGDFGIWVGLSGGSSATNNGQVSGVAVAVSGWAGNDTIILGSTSTTTGAKAVDAITGNDRVVVFVGATVNGVIDGNGGTDTLTLQLSGAETNNELTLANARATICNSTATNADCAGTLTLAGKTYTFSNFEQLILLLQAILSGDAPVVGGEPASVGPQAICDGSVKVFRQPNGDLDVYSGFDLLPPNGFLVGRITAGELAAGVRRFQDIGTAAEQGWVVEVTLSDKLIIQVFDGQGNPAGGCSL